MPIITTSISTIATSKITTPKAENSYLIFTVSGIKFGVAALSVQEVVRLPEVSAMEEVPSYIRGLVDLRGKTIPVMDLDIRLGRSPPNYELTDAMLVMRHGSMAMGVIINEVLEVVSLTTSVIEPLTNFEGSNIKYRLINTVARTADGLVLLLDNDLLFHFVPLGMVGMVVSPTDEMARVNGGSGGGHHVRVGVSSTDEIFDQTATVNNPNLENNGTEEKIASSSSPHSNFFQGVNAEARAEFARRARQLQKPLMGDELEGSLPLAVVRLAAEYLAIELSTTAGFATLSRLTPIPCCPPHILGSMNLRGDNLTVVDIRTPLNIAHNKNKIPHNVMVVRCQDYSVGVPIDEVVDVIHLRAESINRLPATVETMDRTYLKGMATYAKQMLALVDMPKLLAKPELTVYEEV